MEAKSRHREVIDLADSTTTTEGKDSAAKGTPSKVESFFGESGKGLPLRYEDEVMIIEEVVEERRTDSSVIVEDPAVIKERLMQLVVKGQQEAEMEEEQRRIRNKMSARNAIYKAKDDSDMYDKKFLQVAQSTINTQLERPPVAKWDPKTTDFVFMCIDIDFYIEKAASKCANY